MFCVYKYAVNVPSGEDRPHRLIFLFINLTFFRHHKWNQQSKIPPKWYFKERRYVMPESTYKIIELVGVSRISWEDAAKNAIEVATKTIKDMRVAEVIKLDLTIEDDKVSTYRTRMKASFKYLGF
jgi:flavin-binding protein dodecin